MPVSPKSAANSIPISVIPTEPRNKDKNCEYGILSNSTVSTHKYLPLFVVLSVYIIRTSLNMYIRKP